MNDKIISNNAILLLWIFVIAISVSCTLKSEIQQIKDTCKKVISVLAHKDHGSLISLIGYNNLAEISKDEEMVNADFRLISQRLQQNAQNISPKYIVTNTFNFR